MNIIDKAAAFAEGAHKAVGQKRKYTGECYFNHPLQVAKLVSTVTDSQEMIAAAFLHDVVEDTGVSIRDITIVFGENISAMVSGLTDISILEDGKRAIRKGIDRNHTAKQCANTKTIKLADMINNRYSIEKHSPRFAVVYMAEMKLLLEVLKDGDTTLYAQASEIVEAYYKPTFTQLLMEKMTDRWREERVSTKGIINDLYLYRLIR